MTYMTRHFASLVPAPVITASHDEASFTIHYPDSDKVETLDAFEERLDHHIRMEGKFTDASAQATVNALRKIAPSVRRTLASRAEPVCGM